MAKYRCTICGYIYDPAVGDSTQGINPGTAFEDLPDSWTCPVCGAPEKRVREGRVRSGGEEARFAGTGGRDEGFFCFDRRQGRFRHR